MLKKKTFVSFVIYTRNEDKSIYDFLIMLDEYVENHFENFEYIIVNDASTDKTINVINKCSEVIKAPITLVNLAWQQGGELGISSGNDIAIGDFIYEIEMISRDYPFEIIGKLFEKAEHGYDIVAASPRTRSKLSSKIFYNFLNKVSYLKLNLTTETVRLVSRRAINSITKLNEKIRYRKALYHYSGFPRATCKYDRISKVEYNNKTLLEKLGLALNIILNFSNIGGNIAIILSLFFLLFSLFGGGYAVFIFLTSKEVIEGWTTMMLFSSFGFSGLFFILGIISKYISIMLLEIKNRPLYTIKSIQRLSKK